MDERLEEIRSRCEAATPGPWEICLGSGNRVCTGIKADGDNGTVFIADCLPDYALSTAEKDHRGNMNFIAHAREDIPFLLAELDRLRALAEADRDGRCVVLPNPLTATDVEAIKDIGRIVNNLDTMAELVKKKEKKA